MGIIIAPSILSADFGKLKSEIEMINNSEADWVHIDIMDGVFVPNISFGTPVMKTIALYAKKKLDVHLMIVNPEKYVKNFAVLGADSITVHFETCQNLKEVLGLIKEQGIKAGIAINPNTPVEVLENYIHDIDIINIMSVNPGFGGQEFIEDTYIKIKKLKKIINHHGALTLIEVDGGVSDLNAQELVDIGVNVLVAGSYIFNSKSPVEVIAKMKSLE